MTFIKLIIFITERRPITITAAACNLIGDYGWMLIMWSSTSLYLEHHATKHSYLNHSVLHTLFCPTWGCGYSSPCSLFPWKHGQAPVSYKGRWMWLLEGAKATSEDIRFMLCMRELSNYHLNEITSSFLYCFYIFNILYYNIINHSIFLVCIFCTEDNKECIY